MITDMHLTSWMLGLILLVVSITLFKKGNQKGYKITHMILRVVFLLIIATGADLLFRMATITGEYIGKAMLGLVVIGLAEVFLSRLAKGKSTKGFSIALAVVFALVVIMGLQMPMGFDLF
ncbi:MAG: YisL family protein [Bacillus sp. (in: firmicutes)]